MMMTSASKLTEICFRTLLCLFGILGNSSLLIFTIPAAPRRIEPYKILLINLALSDLLTNFMVDFPGILVEIYGTWFLGNWYCKIFWFMSSLSITNSILTTLVMSLFWFQKLVGGKPMNSYIHRSAELRRLKVLIPLGWLVSVTFSVPFFFVCGVNVMKNEGEEPGKQKFNQSIFGCQDDFPSRSQKNLYEVLYLVLANALPIIGMLIINVRVIAFLIRNRKRVTTLRCLKSAMMSSGPSCAEDATVKCQVSGGLVGSGLVSCITSIANEIESAQSFEGDVKKSEGEQKQPPWCVMDSPCSYETTKVCDLKSENLDLTQETPIIPTDGNTYPPGEVYTISLACSQEQCILGNGKDNLPYLLRSLNFKVRPAPKKALRDISVTTQIRAAISIMAVVGVFMIFWVTHLAMRIREDTDGPEHIIDTASLIAASYTTIIPYIFIYSMKKCPCG